MVEKLSRKQLIELVEKLLSNEGTEQQDDEWLHLVKCNVPHPRMNNLIYRTDLSAEEIIDQALAYEPVPLGPSSKHEALDE